VKNRNDKFRKRLRKCMGRRCSLLERLRESTNLEEIKEIEATPKEEIIKEETAREGTVKEGIVKEGTVLEKVVSKVERAAGEETDILTQ
jgi:hypothetical protein